MTFLFMIGTAALVVMMNSRGANPATTISPTSTSPSTSPSQTMTVTPVVTPTPTPSETSTPTLSPTIDKGQISMTILNGSGTAGQANTLRAHLEKEGFSVRRIAVTTTRENSIIYYQTGKKAEAELVASFIPDRVLVFEENPEKAGKDTILIILGQK